MPNVLQWVVLVFGVILTLLGLFLFLFREQEGLNRIKLPWLELESSTPALVIFVAGVLLVAAPLWLAVKIPAQVEQAGTGVNQTTDKQANEIWFSSKPIKVQREECLSKGKEALNRSDFTGIDAKTDLAYGYDRKYTATVWCYPSNDMAIFIVSGPDTQTLQNKLTNLERGF